MDDRQFDRWTRVLAGSSRRDAIKSLVTGLATGSLVIAGDRGALAQVGSEACGKQGDRCRRSSDCCNKFKCKNDKCRDKNNNKGNCGKQGDRCNRNNDCCGDHRCKNNKCRRDSNNDNCGRDGDRCKRDGDCCNNLRCRNDRCR